MAKALVVRWLETKRAAKPLAPKAALAEVRKRLAKGKQFRLKRERGDFSWGPWLDAKETLRRVKNISEEMPVGELVRVQFGKEDGRVLAVLAVEPQPTVELPSGAERWHPIIQQIYTFVFGTKWKKGTPHFAGAENCRPNRRDPSAWSMHSSWPPVLAIDIGVDSLALGDEINAAIEKKWPYPTVIPIWREPLHYSHLHCQQGHNRDGRPECAG